MCLTPLLAMGCVWAAMSQQPAIAHLQHFALKEGLSDRNIRDILQDSRGFVWLATDNGLNRYDGYQFEVFDNLPGGIGYIRENKLRQIRELRGRKLALINGRGLQYFEILDLDTYKSSLVLLTERQGIEGQAVAIFAEPLGDVYVLATAGNAYHIYIMVDRGVFKKIQELPVSKTQENPGFIKGGSGHFWVADTLNGLMAIHASKKEFIRYSRQEILALTQASNSSYFTKLLYEDKLGRLWYAPSYRKGLLCIDPSKPSIEACSLLPSDEVYSQVWEDGKGSLLFGTFKSFGTLNRLFLIGPNRSVTDYSGILKEDDKINAVMSQDFRQQLFLGSFVGLYNLHFKQAHLPWVLADRALNDSEWDDGISIRSITGDGQGNIFIARELKAWYHLKLPSLEVDTIVIRGRDGQALNLWCCSNLVYDKIGCLWGGSCSENRDGMLHRYDLASKTTKTYLLPSKVVRHIVPSKSGQLWLACGAEDLESGLVLFDPISEKLTQYENADGSNPLSQLQPNFLWEEQNGTVWVGTNRGLVCIDPLKKTSFVFDRETSPLTNDDILAIHQAEDSRLWLGTNGGVNIFHPAKSTVEAYDVSNGLGNNIVCGIVPDGRGHYWLSTFYGLSFFDPKTKLFSNFYTDAGLSFNEFNRLAFYKDERGQYYFGTLNGVNIFDNGHFEKKDTAFHVLFTKATVFTNKGTSKIIQSNLSNLRSLVLDPEDVFARIDFALPAFNKPLQNRYAVWLEGVDTCWRYLGHAHALEFNKPPAGKYKLHVKAAPAQGFWSEGALEMDIVVRQAFYQAAWFQVVMPLAFILLAYLLSLWYVKRVKRKQEEQTRINKKFAELELQALQAQMNPHFVFNALGAIQYFIQNNDAVAADSFLAKFAKLMRLFLESSKNRYIPLSEEIKLLSLYIELEQMRFRGKFEANIQVDEDLDVHDKELPSILLQPFVENAINHGLFHKNSKGNLTIKFNEKADETLVCTIEDNGVGRVKAAQLKQSSAKTHKSRGMQIVDERLEVLKLVDALSIAIKVEDLQDDKGAASGTRVTIEVPPLD